MRTLRTFTLKTRFVLPQTLQQPWYQTCFEVVDLEKCATASSKNLLLRMAQSGGLIFSDLAIFTSFMRSMLMIYCTEGVLLGVNLLHYMWKSHSGTLFRVPHLQCRQRVLQQSALYLCIMHYQLDWMSLLLKMQYGHICQEP